MNSCCEHGWSMMFYDAAITWQLFFSTLSKISSNHGTRISTFLFERSKFSLFHCLLIWVLSKKKVSNSSPQLDLFWQLNSKLWSKAASELLLNHKNHQLAPPNPQLPTWKNSQGCFELPQLNLCIWPSKNAKLDAPVQAFLMAELKYRSGRWYPTLVESTIVSFLNGWEASCEGCSMDGRKWKNVICHVTHEHTYTTSFWKQNTNNKIIILIFFCPQVDRWSVNFS